MPPHGPSHGPPHVLPPEGHKEKAKEVKEAKATKQKQEAKDPKPKIHQEKLHKSHKHRKAASDSDWDFFSESSDSSRPYGTRTPDTSSSGNSARRDRELHSGTDSRRSSRSHHDDYNERHDGVYRLHRRKPTVSPDRPRRSGRPRDDVEEIEIIPASNTRSHRPYLTRSRTSAYRPERFPEHLERPAFHSRHISYDDNRHMDFRGWTPPGRRASMYAPKRPLALDLYDSREEQERNERMEREAVRRDLLRERRQDERREAEAVARELEREAAEIRRRNRAMSRDMLYDERPGRYSRGYDNDRFDY
ncbi:MAG: hypothetical protein Q9201_007791 [Fulgogasparrea decipioides]